MLKPDYTDLETLLNLDGITYRLDNGYWIKFEAHSVQPNEHVPHGLSYSLTLHDRHNTRIIGFDNAHGGHSPRRKKYGGRKVTWDHKHRCEMVMSYEFESAAQLLIDFWSEVDLITPTR